MTSAPSVLVVLPSLVAGFLACLGLIVAIGAQNAFVLRQGLRREHVFWVCVVCALSDAVLIAAGVAGFGFIVRQMPWLIEALRYGGALFLALISVLPDMLIRWFNVPFYFGGTSLIIVVGVALDTVRQMESHLLMRNYEGFLKRSRSRSGAFARRT